MTGAIENLYELSTIPAYFDNQSRIWFYIADRDLSAIEIDFIREKLSVFLPTWTAHNNSLKAFGEILFDRVLLIAVDETQAGLSGCGLDKSVHFVENMGGQLGVEFFDRMVVGFRDEDGMVGFLPVGQFAQQLNLGLLSKNVRVMDTTVKTKADFENSFFKPVESTWVRRFV